MKKLLLALALFSTQFHATQINWNDPKNIELVGQDLIASYEQSGQKAILHRLYEDAYRKQPDYLGITLGSALEKYALAYINQNPNAIKKYFMGLGSPKQLEKFFTSLGLDNTVDSYIRHLTNYESIQKCADKIGLNVTDEELKIIAVIQASAFNCYAPETNCKFNLFREIVEYAYQQIQK